MTDATEVRARLRHVRWIGGGSGAGKSTIARRLADRHGLRLYSTDDAMSDHVGRCTPEEAPFLQEFLVMGMDERWADRSPETMLKTFHWFEGEGFHLIVEDLLRLPEQPGVVVEGFRLLPHLVAPYLTHADQAVWLLPTPTSAGPRSTAAARCGTSPAGPVIRNGPSPTCSTAIACSPNAFAGTRNGSPCP